MKKSMKRTLALLLTLCMVIPMCLVAVNAEVGDVTQINFEIPGAGAGNLFTALSKVGEYRAWNTTDIKTLAENAYATTNFLPVAFNGTGTTAITVNNATADGLPTRMGHNGLEGDWFAFKIKVPKAGTYELALSEYVRSFNDGKNYNDFTLDVYVVDGATGTDQATLTKLFGTSTTEGSATPIGSVDFDPTEINAMLTQNVLDANGKNASITVTNESSEYLVVLKVAEMTGTLARLDLTGITLSRVKGEQLEINGSKMFYESDSEAVEAINNAGNDDIVTLLTDIDAAGSALQLKSGVTLELNGKTLTVASVGALAAQIKDSATDTATGTPGSLVSVDPNPAFNQNNDYLPLKNGTGYSFYKVTAESKGTRPVEDADAVTYGFRLNIVNTAAYSLLSENGLEISGTLTVGEEKVADWEFGNAIIESYISYEVLKITDPETYAGKIAVATLTVNGISAANDAPVIVVPEFTCNGVTLTADELSNI